MEYLMQIIIKSAYAIIIDSHLPLILQAKVLTTIAYIKNQFPTLFTI